MIIKYEKTVEYEIDVSPETILKYAKDYVASEFAKMKWLTTPKISPEGICVSLEDIIHDITEDELDLNDPFAVNEIDNSPPRDACFPRLHEEEDPFFGVDITIGQLEENLKKLQLGKSLW